MKLADLFPPTKKQPEPEKAKDVPARCPPCAVELWREVVAGFAKRGKIVSTLEVEQEVCRQWERMNSRPPPRLF